MSKAKDYVYNMTDVIWKSTKMSKTKLAQHFCDFLIQFV